MDDESDDVMAGCSVLYSKMLETKNKVVVVVVGPGSSYSVHMRVYSQEAMLCEVAPSDNPCWSFFLWEFSS